MRIKLKKTNKNAVIPFKNYQRDYCYDVTATSCEEVAPNVYKYGIGLALQFDETDPNWLENHPNFVFSIDFRPRSSVWKTGLVLSNIEGTIDEIYTGEIFAVFYHIMPNMPKYEVGNRIGQIKIGFTFPMSFVEVEELNPTERGSGGYGSTDKIINK